MLRGTAIDIVVIFVYFAAILLFGSWFGRYTKSTKDFFFGGQRFSWWLIAFSCIATVVGSYSFIKYSTAGFKYGFSSSMTYLNDWFLIPFFVLGWLPIIYFSRVTSIPEYFEKRFDRKTRIAGVFVLLMYLIGYIGINLYTIGVAFNSMLGWDVMISALVISIICGIYMHAGGQTSVIMTDLAQSVILLLAGFLIFILGVAHLGGFSTFWNLLGEPFKLPFAGFNAPPRFNFVGIFWQDVFGSTMAFYFMNQGVMMRFMSAKSVREGRKAIFIVVLLFMPLTALAVSNAGWIGRAMVNAGIISANINPDHIFVEVANRIAMPGLFGFIMAALTAALMSTIDTLINAVSAITVNDIFMPLKPDRDDAYYLKLARWIAIVAAILGLILVPLYQTFKSIYLAHATFVAAVTPPMLVVIFFGAFWKRFNARAAFLTIVVGCIFLGSSIAWPVLIAPFDHGVAPEGYNYMRALYGIVVCTVTAVAVTLLTHRDTKDISGLVIDSLDVAKRKFKDGRTPHDTVLGEKVAARIALKEIEGIAVSSAMMKRLQAEPGDILYIADRRWWLGGIHSLHVTAEEPHSDAENVAYLSEENLSKSGIGPERQILIEKII